MAAIDDYVSLWYGDHGGIAPIDFYVRNAGRYRLVLVFMGWVEKMRRLQFSIP